MLKERARIIATGLLGVDRRLVGAAFFLGFWIRSDLLPQIGSLSRLYPLREYLPLLPLALATSRRSIPRRPLAIIRARSFSMCDRGALGARRGRYSSLD